MNRQREHILDLIRGLSALLVMMGHLRGFIFVDYNELNSGGLLTAGFYFATGLGHQSVMVFFVLSGYFVGGSILSGLGKGSFTWRGYAAARLTRLWVVLVPALMLTWGIDQLGAHWNPSAYAGGLNASFMSGPTSVQPAAHDWVTLLGNLGFVQTVSVPVYGTNGPLWSLANEFWYYVMFPLVIVAIIQRGWHAWLQVLLLCLIAWWLPMLLVMGGLIWAKGAAVWWLLWKSRQHGQFNAPALISFFRGGVWRVIGGGIFLGTLAASKTNSWIGSDITVGTSFAFWMLSLPGSWGAPAWMNRLVTGLSEISYTLYVVHFPLLFFIAAVVLKGRQFPADAQGFVWFGGLTVATLAVSTGMWWLFERNTDRVRKLLSGRV